MPWLRLRTPATAVAAEDVADRLADAGALAVSVVAGQPEKAAGHWRNVLVEGLFPVAADLGALPELDFDVGFLADEDWSSTWREGFGPRRFGRLRIVPQQHPVAEDAEPVLRLDPGLAFGTGSHPTTAACLEWLAAHLAPGQRVLDVGCGSGILALAAHKLGADAVAGVDTDPQARRASRRNAACNNVPLTVFGRLEKVPGRFDVVVANILADTLCGLAAELAKRADALVLAGLLPAQAPRVASAFPAFVFEPPAVADGWALLSGRRCAVESGRRHG